MYLPQIRIHVKASFVVALLPLATHACAADIRFDRDIRPILSDRCFHCHGPDTEHREADLRLDQKEAVFAEHDGHVPIAPGNLNESEIWRRITADDEAEVMPPPDSNKTLDSSEKELIRQWIEQGAEWTDHWSFVAPKRPEVPQIETPAQAANPIDRFVAHRLQEHGLHLQKLADRRTLIRRVSFDLTGLPPTPQEVQKFLDDNSATAYEKMVDHFLNSLHFGERMAVMWLDAARYGDTSVYHADGPRDMWAWRDRVVQAYNDNMPFDRFSTLQLAGDLVADASIEDKILAGFNRNNGTTDEGGAIAEEYRVEYAVDRVKTTSMVWLGLSMECGQCHDHKYDPISQEDYYRFYAFFNISQDGGMQTRNGNANPILNIPDPEKEKQLPGVREQLASAKQQQAERRMAAMKPFEDWLTLQEAEVVSNSKALIPTGETLHFTFDEGKGKKVANSVNAEQVGTVRGKAKWESGKFNTAIELDGKSYVDFGDIGRFERTDSVSYGGWLNIPKNSSGALLARMDNNNAFRGFDCLISGSSIEVHIVHKWPENALKVRTKKQLPENEWTHVFCTYDGSSKASGIKIYVNGEIWETDVQQDGLSETIHTEKPFYIGSRNPDSRLKGKIDEVKFFARLLSDAEVKQLAGADPIGPLLQIARVERTEQQQKTLFEHFLANVDEEFQELTTSIEKLQQEEQELLKPLTSVMIMSDMAKPRETFMLNRGRYDSPSDTKVEPGTPAILPPMPADVSKDRLGLANWLFSAEHPLTARVVVNRYWQLLFGNGLVRTPEDFGSQGEFPTHPELLDWLAVDFRESGWDIKRMLKQILMSKTYQQDSGVSTDRYQRDPENRLWSRGPRFRLQGEFIRDHALSVSGLLTDRMGGPGVKPYQPPGLWAEVGLGGNPKFVQDKGDKLFRRSLYTYWKRSAPPPNMQIFDAPTREKCTLKRPRTNTPLQALVMLNDVQYVEAARHFAARLMQEGGQNPLDKIKHGFALAVSRPPSEREQAIFTALLNDSLQKFQSNGEAAKQLLSIGDSPNPEGLDSREQAAWTIVASTLLNMDETLTRN